MQSPPAEAPHQLLLLAAKIRTLSVPMPDLAADISHWFDRFENQLPPIQSGPKHPIDRLRRLMEALPSDPGNRQLAQAIHATIAAIAERDRLESVIAKRVEQSIYDFAYGLTHEINNPLANIAARAQQLLSGAASSRDQKSLATIVDQSMRAHEMLAEMMAAVKPPQIELVRISLNESLELAIEQLSNAIETAKIELSVDVPEEPITIAGALHPLAEAIASLLRNALEACQPGDQIDIRIKQVSKESRLRTSQEVAGNVVLEIRDTGKGLAPDAADRAYHLYYSGRESGRGLGISLAKAKRTLTAHNGTIQLTSHPTTGTTAAIILPTL